MSIASQIELLAANKATIKAAIQDKNPSVPPTDVLSQWPASIQSIPAQKPEQTKTASPTVGGTTVYPDSGSVLSSVSILPVTSSIDANITAGNIKKDISILGVTGTYEGGGGGLQGYNFHCDTMQEGGFHTSAYPIDVLKNDGTIVQVQPGNNESDVIAIHICSGVTGCAKFNGTVLASYSSYDGVIRLTQDSHAFRYENWLCILKGAKITLANGSEKLIEDITFDDELLVWDFDNGCYASAKPIWIKKKEVLDYYFINKYKSGKELLTTGQSETGWGHRTFDLNKNKFIYTTESVSDKIFTLDGVDVHMSCERIEKPCEFHNIITEKHFNLFANRILTSCSLNNLYPIKDMKYVKDDRKPRMISEYDNIPQKWFDGLRLSENGSNISKLNKYVKNLMEKNND